MFFIKYMEKKNTKSKSATKLRNITNFLFKTTLIDNIYIY
jgi:uncharacterized membrane protein